MNKILLAVLIAVTSGAAFAETEAPVSVPDDVKQIVLAYAHTRRGDLMYNVPKRRYGVMETPEPRYLNCEAQKLASTLQRVTDAYQLQDALQVSTYSQISIGILSKCIGAGYFGDFEQIFADEVAARRVRELPLATLTLLLANNLFFEQDANKRTGMPVSKLQVQHAKRLATWSGSNGENATAALARINSFKP
jgi:hypothetical protein